jgi:hypothetical protein
MTSHNAIRDSIIEMSRRVGKYNLDVPEVKSLMEDIERSKPGPDFTEKVRQVLQPITAHISTKNIEEISKSYPEFPLQQSFERVPASEQGAIWTALGMTNMLLTTLQMVPQEMLQKIEMMTNTMMNTMQSGTGAGGLNDLFKNMGSLVSGMGDDEDSEDEVETLPKIRNKNNNKNNKSNKSNKSKSKKSSQQEFRDKLC